MENMEDKIGSILGNPEMMQKIMSMAQNLNQMQPQTEEQTQRQNTLPPSLNLPDIDPSMLQRLSGFMGQANIDSNEKSLLAALAPYLSRERIVKLEKAMRAAKMANLATTFLNSSGLLSQLGR